MSELLSDSKTVTFTICNTAIGPSVLLLSLINVNSGLLTFSVICIVLGLISGYCGELTHLTSIPGEHSYLPAVSRVLGKIFFINQLMQGTRWRNTYLLASVLVIWLGEIIYLLSLCDALYGECPSQDDFTFKTFSYQWVGIGVLACLGWTFFRKGLKEQMKYSAKGIFFVLFQSFFLIYLGIYSLASGKVKFSWYESQTEATGSLPMMTDGGIANAAGVYAAAYIVHCFLVEYTRTNNNQANNSKDIKLAFYIIIFIYFVSGIFGAMGLYYRPDALNGNANTVLSVTLYDRDAEPVAYYFAILCQFFAVIQLSFGLPPIVNVAKVQISTILNNDSDQKKGSIQAEGHSEPQIANSVNFIVGAFFLVTGLLLEMFNYSPNLFMDIAGTFTGFVLVFLVPCYMYWIGLKRKQRAEESASLLNSEKNYVPELVAEMKPNYVKEFGIISFVFLVGLYILVINIQTLVNTVIADL